MAGESVILVGGGGREHAIAEAIGESPNAPDTLYCTTPNVGIQGMQGDPMNIVTIDCKPTDIARVIRFVDENVQDPSKLTVVIGPEAPLVAGMADRLRERGLAVFGPSAEAAKLEGSKIHATEFMREFDIPHPKTTIVRHLNQAQQVLDNADHSKLVLKADGLAGGKGVVLPKTRQEMLLAARSMLDGSAFDRAGETGILVQERLTGPEISVFVVADGRGGYSIIPYFAQDHKRLNEGDEGPNTGGMGAYSPLPEGYLNPDQLEKIEDIVRKTIEGMESRGTPYQGFLYVGLMMAEERGGDPVVIEYNCRFGDPEAQVVLPLLTDSGVDMYEVFRSTARGEMPRLRTAKHLGNSALTVTLAAEGYPDSDSLVKGDVIIGLSRDYRNVRVYHGSTKRRDTDRRVVTDGGRVLYVTGIGRDIDEAAAAAYKAIGHDGIHFEGMQVRNDIGHRIRSGYSR